VHMIRKYSPWLLSLGIAVGFFFANWTVDRPSVYPDEGGYLAYAAGLAGYWKDAATSYNAGYSVLLIPAFLMGGDPIDVFLYVKVINSILSGLTAVVLYGILQVLFPSLGQMKLTGITAVSFLYPAWIVYNGWAMSESAFVLFYTLSVYFALRVIKDGRFFWILWAFTLGYLFVIHAKSMVILGSAILVSFLIAKTRRDWRWLGLFGILILGMVIFNDFFFEPWLTARMTTGDYPPNLHYPSSARYLMFLVNADADQLLTIVVTLSGHLMYIGLATLGLALYPFMTGLQEVWANRGGKVYKLLFHRNNPVFLYMALSFMTTLLLSVVHFSIFGYSTETYIYGRYVEGVVLPLIALGLVFFRPKYMFIAILATGVAAAILSLEVSDAGYMSGLKSPGFWQDAFWRNQGPLVWWAGAVFLMLVTGFLKNEVWRFGFMVAFFLGVSYLQIDRHYRRIQYQMGSENIAYIVREFYNPGTCVGFDPGERPSGWGAQWLDNSFYLYDYDYKRLKPENWRQNCAGPLISTSSEIGNHFTNVTLLAVGKNDLYLWDDSERAAGIFLRAIAEESGPINIFPGFFAAHFMLQDGWHSIEDWGAWSSKEAEILFALPGECVEADCAAELFFTAPYASPTNPAIVIVESNGTQVAEWVVMSTELQKQTIPLSNPVNRLFRITLFVPGAKSPKELGLADDARQIGIGLTKVKFVTTKP
jgi:hypothetical protein